MAMVGCGRYLPCLRRQVGFVGGSIGTDKEPDVIFMIILSSTLNLNPIYHYMTLTIDDCSLFVKKKGGTMECYDWKGGGTAAAVTA